MSLLGYFIIFTNKIQTHVAHPLAAWENLRLTRSIVTGRLWSWSWCVKTQLHVGWKVSPSHTKPHTHLFLSADVADDGVWSWAGRGAEDGYHAFGHDLAHWGREKKGWGWGGNGGQRSARAATQTYVTLYNNYPTALGVTTDPDPEKKVTEKPIWTTSENTAAWGGGERLTLIKQTSAYESKKTEKWLETDK